MKEFENEINFVTFAQMVKKPKIKLKLLSKKQLSVQFHCRHLCTDYLTIFLEKELGCHR